MNHSDLYGANIADARTAAVGPGRPRIDVPEPEAEEARMATIAAALGGRRSGPAPGAPGEAGSVEQPAAGGDQNPTPSGAGASGGGNIAPPTAESTDPDEPERSLHERVQACVDAAGTATTPDEVQSSAGEIQALLTEVRDDVMSAGERFLDAAEDRAPEVDDLTTTYIERVLPNLAPEDYSDEGRPKRATRTQAAAAAAHRLQGMARLQRDDPDQQLSGTPDEVAAQVQAGWEQFRDERRFERIRAALDNLLLQSQDQEPEALGSEAALAVQPIPTREGLVHPLDAPAGEPLPPDAERVSSVLSHAAYDPLLGPELVLAPKNYIDDEGQPLAGEDLQRFLRHGRTQTKAEVERLRDEAMQVKIDTRRDLVEQGLLDQGVAPNAHHPSMQDSESGRRYAAAEAHIQALELIGRDLEGGVSAIDAGRSGDEIWGTLPRFNEMAISADVTGDDAASWSVQADPTVFMNVDSLDTARALSHTLDLRGPGPGTDADAPTWLEGALLLTASAAAGEQAAPSGEAAATSRDILLRETAAHVTEQIEARGSEALANALGDRAGRFRKLYRLVKQLGEDPGTGPDPAPPFREDPDDPADTTDDEGSGGESLHSPEGHSAGSPASAPGGRGALMARLGVGAIDDALLTAALTPKGLEPQATPTGRRREQLADAGELRLREVAEEALQEFRDELGEISERDRAMLREALISPVRQTRMARDLELGEALAQGEGGPEGTRAKRRALQHALQAVVGAVERQHGEAVSGPMVRRLLEPVLDDVRSEGVSNVLERARARMEAATFQPDESGVPYGEKLLALAREAGMDVVLEDPIQMKAEAGPGPWQAAVTVGGRMFRATAPRQRWAIRAAQRQACEWLEAGGATAGDTDTP